MKLSGVNCKYYDTNDFSDLYIGSNNLLLFHLNIASLSKHFLANMDMTLALLVSLRQDSRIIFLLLIVPGYNYAHTPTKDEKSGALLYVSHDLQYTERVDLDSVPYKDEELGSKFIEIIKTNDKNIIVGCIYRHPSKSVNEFNNDYLNPLLDKASSENKLLFLLVILMLTL